MTSDELRTRRRLLGLTQKQLGEVLAIPEKTIARWEQGVFPIQHPVMLALAFEALEKRATKQPS